jgi:UDP-2,3-diacylglucosamine pyrophosphatase LpxH
MSRILVVPDLHEPCSRKGALQFCQDVRRKWKTDKVIFIGDITDWHSISFHAHHPEMPGPKDEYELAYKQIQKWYKTFPNAKIVLGNHDRRIIRLAESVNIPAKFLRDYKEIWNTPTWEWADDFIMDDVYYTHGDGTGGSLYPAYNLVRKIGMNCVCGHYHSAGGVKWLVNPLRRIFGMDTGCLIDDKQMAFAYGMRQKVRSVLSVGVVLDGIPYHIMMPCGRGEKYHDSRF